METSILVCTLIALPPSVSPLKILTRVLVALDRFVSSSLGRPCAIHDEDFDLDLPVECDDEYWTSEDPKLAWKQPSGKPSYVAYFIAVLRLNQILAFALRTIVSRTAIYLSEYTSLWRVV